MSRELEQVWDEEESSRAGSSETPPQESGHIVLYVVSSNGEWLGFTGPIED